MHTAQHHLDLALLNPWQRGFPLCREPFAVIGERLCMDAEDVLSRYQRLQRQGSLSRIGAVFAPGAGGASLLAAMAVPQWRWERVVEQVNRRIEVAHNYRRNHLLNMWFVLAAADAADIGACLRAIEEETGLPVLAFPKEREYFLEMKLEV